MEDGSLQASAGIEESLEAVAKIAVSAGQPAVNRFPATL
jgi:hypothetical protein